MSEKLVIIPAKVSPVKKFFKTFLFVLACLFFLGATFLSPTLFFVPAIIVGIIWGYLTFYSKIEYEYTYYDGVFKNALETGTGYHAEFVFQEDSDDGIVMLLYVYKDTKHLGDVLFLSRFLEVGEK